MGEDSAGALLEALDQCLRHGLPFGRIEADYQTPAGERRVLGITISPMRGTQGEALGAACQTIGSHTGFSRATWQPLRSWGIKRGRRRMIRVFRIG